MHRESERVGGGGGGGGIVLFLLQYMLFCSGIIACQFLQFVRSSETHNFVTDGAGEFAIVQIS